MEKYKLTLYDDNNQAETDFINNCRDNIDFKKYIGKGNYDNLTIDNTYLVYINEIKSGLFFPNITHFVDKKIASPTIYMERKNSRATSLILGEIIYILFNELKTDLLRLLVYSNNKNMLNMLMNFGVKSNGVFKRAVRDNGNLYDIHFYTIDAKKYMELKNKYRKMFKYVLPN